MGAETLLVQINVLQSGAGLPLPAYHSAGASGLDLYAALTEPLVLCPHQIGIVPCGFSVAIPQNYEAQIRPRSGLAVNHGVTIINSPATIDSDYRGEVKVALINHGSAPF